MKRLATTALFLALAACNAGKQDKAGIPGESSDTRPFSGIGEDETLRFTGTEPFWSGSVTGTELTYTTPDRPQGIVITVARFAGRGGLSYSGALDGAEFVMAVSPGQCSDGMSDRSYPFNVTLKVANETRNGCAWSEAHPFTGPAAP